MAATRISSRSSLLPLCTLSPGGVAHRPTSLTQSSTAWSQKSTGNTDTGFPKSVQQSLDDLIAMISEKASRTGYLSFPRTPGILPLEFNTGNSGSGNALSGFSGTNPDSQLWTGYIWFSSGQHSLTGSEMNQDIRQRSYWFPPQRFCSESRRVPTHGSVQGLYLHAPGLTLVTLGIACIPQRASPLHVPSFARNLG
jgi:hypothetical protein